MPRNWKNKREEEGFNYWPAFADMAAATCMMLVIFWIAGVLELGGSKDHVARLNTEIAQLKVIIAQRDADLARLEKQGYAGLLAENRRLEKELSKERDSARKRDEELAVAREAAEKAKRDLAELENSKPNIEPPNIVLKQDESFVFPSLQASVPKDFENRFKKDKKKAVIEALNSSSNIEVIEIIGHTDNVQVGGKSNVDSNLESVYAGTKPVGSLEFGSNCELGLARAIAVKAMLYDFLESLEVGDDELSEQGKERIRNLTYRTYSAAQLFPTDATKPGRDEDRRIEIRFTRLRKTTGEQTSIPKFAE